MHELASAELAYGHASDLAIGVIVMKCNLMRNLHVCILIWMSTASRSTLEILKCAFRAKRAWGLWYVELKQLKSLQALHANCAPYYIKLHHRGRPSFCRGKSRGDMEWVHVAASTVTCSSAPDSADKWPEVLSALPASAEWGHMRCRVTDQQIWL